MIEGLSPELLVYGFTTASDPQVSPDGTTILYTLTKVDQETKKVSSQIWRCFIDGSNPRQLTWSGRHNGSARWSPSGSMIAFVSDRSGKPGLFLMTASVPGEARQLNEQGAMIVDPVWSPDGTKIV